MSIGPYRLELGKFRWLVGGFSDRPKEAWPRWAFLPAVLFAGAMTWLVASGESIGWAESELAPAAIAAPVPAAPAASAAPTDAALNSPSEQAALSALPAISGLKISSQSWRRGGLGSNALFTFTLRNNNDYAVKDVEILCAFTRRDGSHLTDRMRVIPDTIEMRSRKTFRRMHVGFVNINASKAICSLVTANRI